MAREKKKYIIITFLSTHDAMAMESTAHERGIPGRLIPLPSQISAGCGMAWRMLPEEYEKNNLSDIKYEGVHEADLY